MQAFLMTNSKQLTDHQRATNDEIISKAKTTKKTAENGNSVINDERINEKLVRHLLPKLKIILNSIESRVQIKEAYICD